MKQDNLFIEITLRKGTALSKFDVAPLKNEAFHYAEMENKFVAVMPITWHGFEDGTLAKMIDIFDEAIYIALAYIATGNERVTDLAGNSISRYEVVIDGKKMWKFVKKELRILCIIDASRDIFEVKSFIFDIKVVPPVVKVLDVYSNGDNSGLSLDYFYKK